MGYGDTYAIRMQGRGLSVTMVGVEGRKEMGV